MIFTDKESSLYASVIKRMTLAGWLEGHQFIVSVGYKLRWSERGAQRAFLLKQIIQDHSLFKSEESVLRFNRRCLEKFSDIPNEELPPADVDFWLTCMKELDLEKRPACLWPLVRVLNQWQPQFVFSQA